MIVADTNLVVYLLIPGRHTVEAEQVYSADPQWAAPFLWRSEFRNVLSFYVRQGLLRLDEALGVAEDAEALFEGQEFQVPSPEVLKLAASAKCPSYDCEFVALARELGVPLVTSDKGLISRFKPTAVSPHAFCA